MAWVQRVVTMAALVAVAATIAPTERAWACSCAEPTIDELTEREPDAAVVRIRRIDQDGGTSGVGEVQDVLRGPSMPDQVPLSLDDGGSCLPWVAVGDVAVLALVPDGRSWQTLECGLMHPATGLEPVAVDPAASGPAAVLVTGRLPGADLIALDEHLRVLAAAELEGVRSGLSRCGDDLLVSTGRPEGGSSLVRVVLPGLDVLSERSLSEGPDVEVEVLEATCDADRVDVLTRTWGADVELHLRRDVFGSDDRIELPTAEDAAFIEDEVLLLRQTADGDAELLRHSVSDGSTGTVERWGSMSVYEFDVAPDGAHALIRGFGDEPVLLVFDLASGTERSRSTGWWQPISDPWLSDDRFVQIDENSGGIGDSAGLASHRIVDLDLVTTSSLEPTPGWNAVAGEGNLVRVAGDRFTVHDAAGRWVRTAIVPWAGGVYDAIVLGSVAPGAEQPDEVLPPVDDDVARAAALDRGLIAVATTTRSFAPVLAVALLVALGAVGAVLVLRRRRAGS